MINEQKVTFPDNISSGLCKYFTNVGKTLAENIPDNKTHCTYYMNDNANRNSLYLTPTRSEVILRIIIIMDEKTSSGYDSIKLLSVCVPLAAIINKSLVKGEVLNI